MLIHYFTLVKISQSLHNIIGSKLIEAYSQEKDTAVLMFFDGTQVWDIKFSTLVNFEAIFLYGNAKKKSNAVNLLQNLYGEYLKEIQTFENNRLIKFEFTNSHL